jgi:hypothetical protein
MALMLGHEWQHIYISLNLHTCHVYITIYLCSSIDTPDGLVALVLKCIPTIIYRACTLLIPTVGSNGADVCVCCT